MTNYDRLETVLQFKVRGKFKLPYLKAALEPSRSGFDYNPFQQNKMLMLWCLNSEKGRIGNDIAAGTGVGVSCPALPPASLAKKGFIWTQSLKAKST